MNYYKPFSNLDLISALQEVERNVPLAQLSRNRVGNLCIYSGGEYVGFIELHDPPEFTIFDGEDD